MTPVTEVDAPGLQVNLLREMQNQGLSYRNLAEKSGVDKNTLHRWTSGYRRVRFEKATQVAAALDVPVGALLGEQQEPPTGPPEQEPRREADYRDLAQQLAELRGVLRGAADAVTPDLMTTLNRAADLAQQAVALESSTRRREDRP